jgi:mRNA interferase RelE/StbE
MYKIIWSSEAERNLKEINWLIAWKIKRKTEGYLANDPYRGLKMSGNWEGCYRIKYSTYRVIYTIENKIVTVKIVKVGHRSNVYNK